MQCRAEQDEIFVGNMSSHDQKTSMGIDDGIQKVRIVSRSKPFWKTVNVVAIFVFIYETS
jgi:hypothetical protein